MSTKIEEAASAPTPLPHFSQALESKAGARLLETVNTTLIAGIATVNVGRRETRRSATLLRADRVAFQPSPATIARTVGAWAEVLVVLRQFTDLLTADSIRELDALVARIDDPTEPYADTLRAAIVSGMGFSPAEYEWGLDQLRRAGFRILFALSGGDPMVLRALVDAACSGDNGILQLGFLTLAESEWVNEQVTECIARARTSDITASIFHLLPAMVLAAACLGDASLPLPRLMSRMGDLTAIFAPRPALSAA